MMISYSDLIIAVISGLFLTLIGYVGARATFRGASVQADATKQAQFHANIVDRLHALEDENSRLKNQIAELNRVHSAEIADQREKYLRYRQEMDDEIRAVKAQRDSEHRLVIDLESKVRSLNRQLAELAERTGQHLFRRSDDDFGQDAVPNG